MPKSAESKQMEKINEKLEKDQHRKKILLEKEKRKRFAKFKDIGRLAYQANIDQFDEQSLLGAFIEIAKNANEEKIHQWKSKAEEFSKSKSKNTTGQVFIISFLEEPNTEIKRKLKENKFSWNRFRKEYYGRGERADIENLLKDCKFKIDEIIN